MVKVKKNVKKSAPTPPPPSPVMPVAGKRKKRSKKTVKYSTPIRRLCKSLDIPLVNKDATELVNNIMNNYITCITKHLAGMLAGTNKTLTKKTSKLAFIAYMETLDVPDEILEGSLGYSDNALEALRVSFEKKK